MAAERAKNKKAFEYKMSKKVSELTQVVHMLFMRNHEREVEINLYKELYDQELDRLHKKYQLDLRTLENRIKAEKEYCEKEHGELSETVVLARIDKALAESDKAWQKKFDTKDNLFLKEKGENVKLKDEMGKLTEELQKLKSSTHDASASISSELHSKEIEANKLRRALSASERKLSDIECQHNNDLKMLKSDLDEQSEALAQVRSMYDEAKLNEECLRDRQNLMENEIKSLRRSLAKKQSSNDKISVSSSPVPSAQPLPQIQSNQEFMARYDNLREVHDELDHLRKLVQKYRLELSNREGNFNRMFTEKNPVYVDQKSMKSLTNLLPTRPNREKSFSYAIGQGFEPIIASEQLRSALVKPDSRESTAKGRRLTSIRRSLPATTRQVLTQYSQNSKAQT